MLGTTIHCEDRARFVTGRLSPAGAAPVSGEYPLVVAIHGGTYTADYFDIAGCSLMRRAAALGIPLFAVNRPGYLDSLPREKSDGSIDTNARILNDALQALWEQHGGKARGIFLIGHSIGGAIAIRMAASPKPWPLLGIAISGVGLREPDPILEHWKSLPPGDVIEIPPQPKDALMYGPAGSFRVEAQLAAHRADHPMPRQELLDIAFEWPRLLDESAPKIHVPVHYRQPEFDHLWVVDEGEVQGFGRRFVNAPVVDAKVLQGAGHCIDFHRLGAAFQLEQLAFALACSVKAGETGPASQAP